MRILLPTGFWFYKTYHSFAKRIKEVYPEAEFGVYGSEESSKFIKDYDDIEYEIFEINDTVCTSKEDIDYEELKKFEDDLPHKSLWRVIASDRGLGAAFLHGAIGYESKHQSDCQSILNQFNKNLVQIREIFDCFNPDLYLEAPGAGGVGPFIFQQICKDRSIPYVVPSLTRVKSYFAFSDRTQLLFPQIDKTYRELMSQFDENVEKFTEADKLYDNLINELEDPQYFDRMNSRFNVQRYDTFTSKVKWVVTTVLGLCNVAQIGIRKKFTSNKPPYILRGISSFLQKQYQSMRITNNNFTDRIVPDQKYIYYPLHINPEYSTSTQGVMWVDQVNLIEVLAKSIPADWKIYVKEHPGTLIARVRPLKFYDRIKSLPNVSLISVYEDMHKLISNAQMVAVITGTAGWEAIQRGVPSITFADNTWDVLGLSKRCANIEVLSNDIYDEIRRMKQITPSERRKRIVCYLAAVLRHSFNMTYPNQFVFTELGTNEEYEVCGRELAAGLIKHLEYLQKEKGYCFG